MANEIVKHHNDLNTVIMRKWTAEEMNFFFAIIAKARDKGTSDLVFNDWFLELDADSLHPYSLINFCDKTKGEVYQIDRVEDGSYIVCTD